MKNMAMIPMPANNSCRLAKKKESSYLYVAHTALALYTMMSPIVNSNNVMITSKKSGDVFFVCKAEHPKLHFFGLSD